MIKLILYVFIILSGGCFCGRSGVEPTAIPPTFRHGQKIEFSELNKKNQNFKK
jgi:hypothetical protein